MCNLFTIQIYEMRGLLKCVVVRRVYLSFEVHHGLSSSFEIFCLGGTIRYLDDVMCPDVDRSWT